MGTVDNGGRAGVALATSLEGDCVVSVGGVGDTSGVVLQHQMEQAMAAAYIFVSWRHWVHLITREPYRT